MQKRKMNTFVKFALIMRLFSIGNAGAQDCKNM